MISSKLSSILLIDDDEATNYYHELVIESTGLVESIVIKETGLLALEYLQSLESKNEEYPKLIFLDINMPMMNGWEFLEAYRKMEISKDDSTIIVMLTTSLNTRDAEKAEQFGIINRFLNKPLTEEIFAQVVESFYSDQAEKAAQIDKKSTKDNISI